MQGDIIEKVKANPKYHHLVSTRNSYGWIMTILMLVVYYGYILMIAFNKEWLAQRMGAGGMGPRRVLARLSGDQRGSTSECLENPNLRRAVPDDDLHGRHVDARHAPVVARVDRSCDLVSYRRIRGVPPGCARRLRPPARRNCTSNLLDAEDQRQLGIAKRVQSSSAGDADISQ